MRFIFIASLVFWVFKAQILSVLAGYITMTVFMLSLQGMPSIRLKQSLYLLFWLFVPIFLFHGFFTPGVYIQKPIYLPLTQEGLMQSLQLCLHLSLFFFAALSISRSFLPKEWVFILDKLPLLKKFKTHLLLMGVMHQKAMPEIQNMKKMWFVEKSKWYILPDYIVETIRKLLLLGKAEAKSLWLSWDQRLVVNKTTIPFLVWSRDLKYTIFVFFGWFVFWQM